jgi:hypothetical protein
MRAKRRTDVVEVPFPQAEAEVTASTADVPDERELRRERIVYDGITNLPIHPFELPERADERIENLGVIYLQVGKFFGFEELFGWESYDQVLATVSDALQDDVGSSRLAPHVRAIRFSGADGFFVLYDLPGARGRVPVDLQDEAARLRAGVIRRSSPRDRRTRGSSSSTGSSPSSGDGSSGRHSSPSGASPTAGSWATRR